MSEALAVQVETLEKMIESGDLAGALDFLEALSQEERAQWQIQNLTGVVCAYCGQFREAEHFFTAALAQKPDDENILYNLKDTQAALEQLKQTEEKGGEPAAGTKKRVLMAAYYFPPLSGSGVFRSIKFAKYLPLYGWQPTVISTDRPPNGWNFADESQVAEIPKDMEVIRIPDGISTGRETSLENSRVQAVLGFLRDILRLSPEADGIFAQYLQSAQGIRNLLTFPCGALCWAYDVVQYIEKNLDLSKFDAIYTTSGPSSAHLIGFYLKRNYGIAWVADYRDPWTDNPYGGYNPAIPYYKMLFELERLLLQQADCNLTVEEGLIKTYMDHFGLPQEKIQCITNGYDEEDFVSLVLPEKRSDKFTVTYSGLIYTKQQIVGFRAFLEAVQQLCKTKKMDRSDFCFYLAGEADRNALDLIHRFGLGDSVRKDSFQAHSNVLQCNLNSDLLLLLVGDEAKQKPVYTGKFFEYLRSGRPILALAPKGGAVARVLRETGHGEALLSTQVGQIKAMILREYRKWQSGEPAELLRAPAIARFERKELTRQLAEVLDTVRNYPPQVLEDRQDKSGLDNFTAQFLKKNYACIWLKAMLQEAVQIHTEGATLITGSSYGINGIREHHWRKAVNCSASSQDLYYDFLCAKRVILPEKNRVFSKCFIVDGYYAACHDVSSGERERELAVSNVFEPVFRDTHNWNTTIQKDLWDGLGNVSDQEKELCEQFALEKMRNQGTFFSGSKQRGGTVFDLSGRNWWKVPPEEREALGKYRADSHNKLFQHKSSLMENKKILQEYVHFLHLNHVTPIFVIAPFAEEYSRHVLREMKESIHELIASVPEDLHFVDFNQFTCFVPSDFVDTDHLSERGAEKFSGLLVKLFGE